MTVSEEQVRIGTRRRETVRARLAKRVETRMETVNRTVPLRREHVEIEYLPLEGGARVPSPPERWLVLYEEEVVLQTRWVARERVRLVVRAISEDRDVSASVRAERLSPDDPADGRQPGVGGDPAGEDRDRGG